MEHIRSKLINKSINQTLKLVFLVLAVPVTLFLITYNYDYITNLASAKDKPSSEKPKTETSLKPAEVKIEKASVRPFAAAEDSIIKLIAKGTSNQKDTLPKMKVYVNKEYERDIEVPLVETTFIFDTKKKFAKGDVISLALVNDKTNYVDPEKPNRDRNIYIYQIYVDNQLAFKNDTGSLLETETESMAKFVVNYDTANKEDGSYYQGKDWGNIPEGFWDGKTKDKANPYYIQWNGAVNIKYADDAKPDPVTCIPDNPDSPTNPPIPDNPDPTEPVPEDPGTPGNPACTSDASKNKESKITAPGVGVEVLDVPVIEWGPGVNIDKYGITIKVTNKATGTVTKDIKRENFSKEWFKYHVSYNGVVQENYDQLVTFSVVSYFCNGDHAANSTQFTIKAKNSGTPENPNPNPSTNKEPVFLRPLNNQTVEVVPAVAWSPGQNIKNYYITVTVTDGTNIIHKKEAQLSASTQSFDLNGASFMKKEAFVQTVTFSLRSDFKNSEKKTSTIIFKVNKLAASTTQNVKSLITQPKDDATITGNVPLVKWGKGKNIKNYRMYVEVTKGGATRSYTVPAMSPDNYSVSLTGKNIITDYSQKQSVKVNLISMFNDGTEQTHTITFAVNKK